MQLNNKEKIIKIIKTNKNNHNNIKKFIISNDNIQFL